MVNLNKAEEPNQGTTTDTNTAPTQITVHAGFAGNIRKFVLDGNNWTVSDLLAYANLDHRGFEIRVAGRPAGLTTPVVDGQTLMLVRPVVGNAVHCGFAGNIKKIVLDGESWTVEQVLRQAELDPTGFEIRVAGRPATLASTVTDGQTVMLVRPVVGNLI